MSQSSDRAVSEDRHLRRGLTRRSALGFMAAAALATAARGAYAAKAGPKTPPAPGGDYRLFYEAVSAVNPWTGYRSAVALKDSLPRLVAHGVLDRDKYLSLNAGPGPVSANWLRLLDHSSDEPIYLTTDNAAAYVDLLWPIGLANHLAANRDSALRGASVDNFASTGGWNLGRAPTGGRYFDSYQIVDLTAKQEELAVRVAKGTFRPCCNNSTFFQDCNHGSALFGVLQLGAAQGLDEAALYREALAFNSFWFPDTYVPMALYFKAALHTGWSEVDPRLAMSSVYSTASGSQKNVFAPLQAMADLFPPSANSVNCGA